VELLSSLDQVPHGHAGFVRNGAKAATRRRDEALEVLESRCESLERLVETAEGRCHPGRGSRIGCRAPQTVCRRGEVAAGIEELAVGLALRRALKHGRPFAEIVEQVGAQQRLGRGTRSGCGEQRPSHIQSGARYA
jgi:hypothetical protein